ncbi:hypothetical protein [Lacicoccus alkaliphilus]|uniref:ABC-type polysaccharide/polyol phosphate transport system, ATPase component n=1 Tax=Lacicoccus alkaliphilus DSM 16010 TaxID=1123231 RepID=A0A1M7KAF9_9BACL|nr:hypothetical protein [Salinicoccus alkaliphilus]SHM62214.1 ABC-type polysaccharide/polyol phosphate transport system, ATPase component [Salinicoccus alkaliphilus DSM 16010]
MQDIILLRGQDLSYAKEPARLRNRMLSKEESLLIKDVSFTLYRGEVLGVLGEYETLYYLKDMITGTVDPKAGRVKSDAVVAALDVMDHVHNRHSTSRFLIELYNEYMKPEAVSGALETLGKKVFMKRIWNRRISSLTRGEIAALLVEASVHIEADAFIFCNMSSHLTGANEARFKEIISGLEQQEKGVMLLETDIGTIQGLSNYFIWLSYGQKRYDGGVQKGVGRYNKYLKEKSQIKNTDEEALFDLEWKRRISEYAHYKHNMQRLSKKQTSLIDRLSIRRIIVSFVLLFIMMTASTAIFMDINFTGAEETVERQTVPAMEAETPASFSYGFITADGMDFGGQTVPYMSMVDVTGTGDGTYTVLFDGAEYQVPQEELLHFNPASLYTETTFEDLLPYTSDSFADSNQFYTVRMNRSAEDVVEELNLEADQYRGTVPGFPITYHFRNDRVFALEFPAEDTGALLEEYDLSNEEQIFRVQDGYMVLDGANDRWLYVGR